MRFAWGIPRNSELYSPPSDPTKLAKRPRLALILGATFDLREDRHGRSRNFLLAADRADSNPLIREEKRTS